jgi:type IV pilus assembly PilX-like protein
MHLSAATRRRSSESGFSLVVVMLTFLAVFILATVAYNAASGDTRLRGQDADRKQAYAAAEAGINYYLYHLRRDPGYWANCTDVPAPGPGQASPINQPWNGTGSDPRVWRTLFDSRASYTIELMPANGAPSCNTTNPQGTMLDQAQGTLQVKATGRMNGETRSVAATLRRKTFLDFLYFTDFETRDPVASQLTGTTGDLTATCSQYRYAGRPEPPCSAIVFAAADRLDGPLHTNDNLLVCGSPRFGRRASDAIEVSGPAPGWQSSSGCSGSPNFVGTFKTGTPIMAMPPSNVALKSVATPANTFTGTTTIRLSGSNMTVTNAARGLNNATLAIPDTGVIYVANGACGASYNLIQDYNQPLGCAVVYIQGQYSKSLTIASEGDVVATGDLTRSGNAALGLIPNNFARVYHPVTNRSGTACTNASNSPRDVDIDAAILSLQHSFIVDNYFCGSALGTLTIQGAIAQRFRGPVGTGGTSVQTGYAKQYTYDDRLAYISPPHFLSPVEAGWELARQTEIRPAR